MTKKNLPNFLFDFPNSLKRGFTLIEMLVVISIMLLMVGLGIANYIDFNDRQTVLTATDELKTHLRTAQTKALAGDLGGCAQLEGYQASSVGSDPVVIKVTALCNDGGTGTITSYDLPAGVSVSPFSIIFPVLADPICLDGNCDEPNPTSMNITISSNGLTYEFSIGEGGEITKGGLE